MFTSPEPVLRARSVAIVGASERARWPSSIFASLRDHGYPGKIYPINPRYQQVWGVTCYPDFASLPEPADHALVIIPAAAVQATLEEGAAHGLKSATVYAASIGEGHDPEIVARGAALKDLCRRTGLIVGGPNCMGAMSMREKAFFYPNGDLCTVPAGPVGAVFQSGGTLQFWCQTGAARGLKFSYMVSSGNELGIDIADYVNFLVEDEHTKTIALFIEGIRRPDAFMAAANKALVAGKPIVAIKTGRSLRSRAAAQSHTGAIAGDYEAYAAMCDRYGIATCSSLDEMVEVALAFQYTKRPKGKRVGWVTTSGGTVDLLYDYMDGERGTVMPDYGPATVAAIQPHIPAEMTPKNPLDSGIPSTLETAAKICAAVAADPAIDMIAWAAQLPGGAGKRKLVDPQPMLDVMAATDKPLVAFGRMLYPLTPAGLEFQDRIGIAHLQGLQPTIRALGALAAFGAREGRKVAELPAPSGWRDAVVGEALNATLASHGMTLPKSAFVKTPAGAADAAGEIGFPVALKIVSAELSHKTEVGGVLLNLKSAAEVKAGAESLAARVHDASLHGSSGAARLDGYLVQEMVSGVEVILGARSDPLYGPVLVVGSGGVMVELVKDVALRLLPVGAAEAREMIAGLKLSRLLAGYRGQPEADTEALVRAICGLSDFYLAHRHWLTDIEINPLIVLPKGLGVRAVDVRPIYSDTEPVTA